MLLVLFLSIFQNEQLNKKNYHEQIKILKVTFPAVPNFKKNTDGKKERNKAQHTQTYSSFIFIIVLNEK